MKSPIKNYGIILASGVGSRFGSDLPKQFWKIDDKTILEHSIENFEKSEYITDIIVVITPGFEDLAKKLILKNSFKKVVKIINGGETRKDSSYIAVNSIDEEEANLLIHDCARPFLSQRIIKDCIKALENHSAVNVAIESSDTIVEIENNIIKKMPSRNNLRRSQTPQCFKLSLIKKAHELSKNDSDFTDDCGLVFKHNLADIYIVEGDIENIKITYKTDLR